MAPEFCTSCRSILKRLARKYVTLFKDRSFNGVGHPSAQALQRLRSLARTEYTCQTDCVFTTYRSCWLCACIWLELRLQAQRTRWQGDAAVQTGSSTDPVQEQIQIHFSVDEWTPYCLSLTIERRRLYRMWVTPYLSNDQMVNRAGQYYLQLESFSSSKTSSQLTSNLSIEPSKKEMTDDTSLSSDLIESKSVDVLSSESTLKSIRQTIIDCEANHIHCKPLMLAHQPYKPTRLLKLDESCEHIRLCEGDQLQDDEGTRYATLSHCWGDGHVDKLLLANHEQMKSSIALARLDKTNREAVALCRSLGIGYLWIDSMCIIQDDVEAGDWNREAPEMHRIYGSSCLTIAATASSCAEEGLFRPLHPVLGHGMAVSVADPWLVITTEGSLAGEQFQHQMASSPLLHRGWVQQEMALSSRVLHMTEGQIYLACRETCTAIPDMRFKSVNHAGGKPLNLVESRSKSALDSEWARLAQTYSETRVTFAADRYVALSGLAALFEERFQDAEVVTQFIAGCWSHNLTYWLPWKTRRRKKGSEKGSSDVYIPSWSWLSGDRVELLANSSAKNKVTDISAEVVKSDVVLQNIGITRGPLKRAVLSLRAPTFYLQFRTQVYLGGNADNLWIGEESQLSDDNAIHLWPGGKCLWDSGSPALPHDGVFLCALLYAENFTFANSRSNRVNKYVALVLEECNLGDGPLIHYKRCGLLEFDTSEPPRMIERDNRELFLSTIRGTARERILDMFAPERLSWRVIDLI